jgi:amino acid adenylation domain-containing protein
MNKCIHQFFEKQVKKTPNAIAVAYEDKRLTYWELNQKANQLAHYLQELGVGTEILVGICMEPSLEMIVGLLGVLKAGGAYVPLDPEYPIERLTFILEETQVLVLIIQQFLVAKLPSSKAHVVYIDADWETIAQHKDDNPLSSTKSDNLAYVIYTSGSTGQPKGVIKTHKNVVHPFEATRSWFNFNERDVWTLFHSYAFDFSVWEIFGALFYGGRLVVVPFWVTRSPDAFYKLLYFEQVTILNQTPSAFRQLIHIGEQVSIPTKKLSLRLVIFGGESLDFGVLKPWFNLHGNECPKLVNTYGLTEISLVTYRLITVDDVEGFHGNSIGYPIPNLQIYLLDLNLNPVPTGVPGEIYVGGDGLARGYLNRPELTKEKFIPNQFSDKPGTRLYKTGDLARYLPDGSLDFLGRIDKQVKIRGFRIDLEEIKLVLEKHTAVSETLVLVREDVPGDKRLVAYVVPKQEESPKIGELRSFLREKLPEYMIPNFFVFLDTLPLTFNGKIDHRALLTLDLWRPDLEESFVAPRTLVEQQIADIWIQLLKIEKVSIYDNFFEVGGDSLLATQIISRLNQIFNLKLCLSFLLEFPTIIQLNERIGTINFITFFNPVNSKIKDQCFSISPIPRTENIPLSFAQRRLWFLDQLEPQSSAYNTSDGYRLTGQINITALEGSLNEIIRRHEILRTTFPSVDGQPNQVIAPHQAFTLPIIDLQEHPETKREALAQQIATEEAKQPFDLADDPLFRVKLLRLAEADDVLLLNMHHIISDGWSFYIFFQELAALYTAFSTNKPSPLPELPIQYADFSYWQREWLQGEVLESQLSYWKQQLSGSLPILQLPTDRPRPPVQTYQGAYQSLELSLKLTEALKALSQQERVTLFMTLLAAFQILLSRYSGQEDIIVGTPIAGRNQVETEGLIGLFVNTLAIRTNLSGNPTFRQLLSQIRAVTLGAYDHQDLPLEKLIEELNPERDISRSPLFQVIFAFQNTPSQPCELLGLTITPLEIHSGIAKFDLTLDLKETSEGIKGGIEYNTDLFEATTITRMLGHFQTLLESIVTNPEQHLSDLPLLTAAEQHQLLVEWNNTTKDYPQDKCIHQLFEEQVERSPDSIAVVFEGEQLTYKELNQRANQLAHHLQHLGVGQEVLVGICMERSLEMIVGLLGILKAGGAYVPLDPNYPEERLAYIFNDSQVSVLLTQEKFVTLLTQQDVPVLSLNTDWGTISQESEENPISDVKPENLAYVIYTSGSTGNPKGVLINHHNVVRLFAATKSWFNFSKRDVWTLFHSYAFDFSVWEIAGALIYGGRLVIVPYLVSREPEAFYDLLEREKVTVLNQTPSAFRQLINAEQSKRTTPNLKLRLVIFGGEALELQNLKPWFERHGDQLPRLVNMYGITETTVHVTYRPLTRADLNIGGSMIGSPIPDLQIYILDQNLQPVPIGVKGEIHVGGAGLARGYLNRPDLTEEKFIPNPFLNSKFTLQNSKGDRLYKTGDLARYLSDGNIEFLGRLDNQVKIRGFRIELGEIELTLAQHATVQQCVVMAREDIPGEQHLVVYIIPHQQQTSTPNELRRFLKQKLPDYMVPSTFVFIDTLPLTPNGKIDRRALPVPDQSRPALEETFVAPRTPIEQQITDIWASILKLENVGIHDNFFALGGHSLLATQVISRLRQALKVELPLRVLFEAPTVAELSSRIETVRWASQQLQVSVSDTIGDYEEGRL